MRISLTQKCLFGYIRTLIFPVLIWLIFAAAALTTGNTYFFSGIVVYGIFKSSVLTCVVGMAIAIPLSEGRWDFAPGTIATLGGIIGVNLAMRFHVGALGLILICITVCIILALFEALLYFLLRAPNMIVSLGVVMAYEALSGIVNGGMGGNIFIAENSYVTKLMFFSKIPYNYMMLTVVLAGLYIVLYHTKYGVQLKALGRNARIAIEAGINEKRNILSTYVIVGILLGIAAYLNACNGQIAAAANLSSTTLMFSSMGPVLIGLFLGKHTCMPWGIYVGTLGMSIITYGLSSLGIDGAIVTIVTGVILVAIMAYTTNGQRMLHFFLTRAKNRIQSYGR